MTGNNEKKVSGREQRKMVFNLAKNDFKSRFAGSYLGIVWAFVNPIVTVLLYWFVFDKALNAASQTTKAGIQAPYVLWLIAGIVPWFYFSEAWSSGTNSLYEYSYLVKKVVFNVEALPVVKIVSSLFVHLFFVAFAIVFYIAYGFELSFYIIQIVYYSFAMIIFTLGLTYITSALVVFFRDLNQIIAIMMQVLMWGTPILWNMDAMNLRPVFRYILMANPMYYIVYGYRDAFINQIWFWEKPTITIYFWVVALIFLFGGRHMFRKFKVHFADVL